MVWPEKLPEVSFFLPGNTTYKKRRLCGLPCVFYTAA